MKNPAGNVEYYGFFKWVSHSSDLEIEKSKSIKKEE